MGISVAFSLVALVAASPALAAPVVISDEARTHFDTGVSYLQDPDGARHEEAYREFKAAYELSPSWKILGNLGIAAMKLERDGEAIDAFKRYLEEGGKDLSADERAQFARDLRTLEASAVKLTLTATPVGAVIIDERRAVSGNTVVNRYESPSGALEIRVRPGFHRITAKLEGYVDQTWEFDATPRAEHAHTFSLEKQQARGGSTSTGHSVPAERPIPAGVFIGLAATGAFAVGAGVTGVLALGKRSDFKDLNDGTQPEKAKDVRDSGRTLNVVTDVLIGAAVVSAALTTVLYVSRPSRASADEQALQVVPSVGMNGGGVLLTRSF